MILINRAEIEPVISSIVGQGTGENPCEPFISIDKVDLSHALEGSKRTLAIVQRTDASLEQMAEYVSNEIAFVMNMQNDAIFEYLVQVICLTDILMSELCIVSDMLRNAVGDCKIQFGISFSNRPESRSISVLLFKK